MSFQFNYSVSFSFASQSLQGILFNLPSKVLIQKQTESTAFSHDRQLKHKQQKVCLIGLPPCCYTWKMKISTACITSSNIITWNSL